MKENSQIDVSGLVECQIEKKDGIPCTSIALYSNGYSNKFSDFYVICENKHITHYLINPKVSPKPEDYITMENELQYDLQKWKKDYPSFFHNAIDRIYSYFEQFVNYFTLEYLGSASFSLRTLYERIVYENFGVWVFYPNLPNIGITGKAYEDINDSITSIGFANFILFLISKDFRNTIMKTNSTDNIKYGTMEFNKTRSQILRKINSNYNAIQSRIQPLENNLKKLYDDYPKLSSSVHGYKPLAKPELENICEHVLKMYNDFFNNSNSWRCV